MQVVSRRKLASYVAEQLLAGADQSALLTQVAAYLVERKRVNQAELLVRDIEAYLANDHGLVLAHVTSARELSDGLIKAIAQFVKQSEKATAVEVSTSIDPSLLGGVIIKTPNAELNASVRSKLTALKA